LQAFWRGFVARKRFQKALSKLRYYDNDDFEYVAIDEKEFVLDPTIFEDEYSLLFGKLQTTKDHNSSTLCSLNKNSTNAILAIEPIKEDHESSLTKSHDSYLAPSVDIEIATILSKNQKSNNMQIQCEEIEIENKPTQKAIDSCSSPHLLKNFDALKVEPFFDDTSNSLLPNDVCDSISFNLVMPFLAVILFFRIKNVIAT